VTADAGVEDLLRELAPWVLGVLVRRYEDFAVCEDAVQEALLAAAQHWPKEGVPSNPRSWLVTAASRAVVDEWRSVRARRGRRPAPSCWTCSATPRRCWPPPATGWRCASGMGSWRRAVGDPARRAT